MLTSYPTSATCSGSVAVRLAPNNDTTCSKKSSGASPNIALFASLRDSLESNSKERPI